MSDNAPADERAPVITTYNEKPLHAGLKEWYARPGDRFEVPLEDCVVDILRGELAIEVQTASFTAIRDKLRRLAERRPVRLLYPVAAEKWLLKLGPDGKKVERRKSPKRGRVEDVFGELVSLPALLAHPHFSLEVVLTREDEVRRKEEGRAWRRKGWVVQERRLLEVVSSHRFESPGDLADLLPGGLPRPFTTADVADALDMQRRCAQQMAYCLRHLDAIAIVGKRGNAILYERAA